MEAGGGAKTTRGGDPACSREGTKKKAHLKRWEGEGRRRIECDFQNLSFFERRKNFDFEDRSPSVCSWFSFCRQASPSRTTERPSLTSKDEKAKKRGNQRT